MKPTTTTRPSYATPIPKNLICRLTTMAVMVMMILAVLATLSGCYSNEFFPHPCSVDDPSDGKCFSLIFGKSEIGVRLNNKTLHFTNTNRPNILESKEINRELGGLKIRMSVNSTITLEFCDINDANIITRGYIESGPISDIRFLGFGKLARLAVHGTDILHLKKDLFQSLKKLSSLDLSHNGITTMDKNVFDNLTELKRLELSDNKFESLHEKMFEHQKELTTLVLDGKELRNLTKQIFHGLDSLTYLEIRKTIFELSGNEFYNIPRLQVIVINNCGLHRVAVTSFNNLSDMKELDLSFNEITNLEDGLFDGLKELVRLDLASNKLENISVLIFRDLQNLVKIDLSRNHLTTIHPGAFINTTKLEVVRLSHNQLSFSDNKLPFTHLYNLRIFFLNDNRLTTIRSDAFTNTTKLEFVDLSENQLSFIDHKLPFTHLYNLRILNLKYNNVTRFPSDLEKLSNIMRLDLSHNQISSLKYSEGRHGRVELSGNPLDCDCSMLDFWIAIDLAMTLSVGNICLESENSTDSTPCRHRESSSSVKCPAKCSCTEIVYNDGIHVSIHCKLIELTSVPEIENFRATTITLDLRNNSLTELPKLQENLTVIFIQASFNQISTIALENIPPNLRGLDLSHNKIETIAAKVIHRLKNHPTLEIFFLKGNPLACHCSDDDTIQFIEFVQQNGSITDLQEAKCNEHDELSMEVLTANCRNSLIIRSLIISTILAIVTGTLSVLFIRHREFIKIWLYTHDWFLWWVDEEYVDRDKVYDVYISYANENRDLALHLAGVLEECCLSFKCCIHERDFICGSSIEESVIDAVKNSRRIMVILSENYLRSQWCTHEFHLALERSLSEKRTIIIAVKYGDLGNVADADSTIGSYLKAHTYIESNDKWFWERILYALPHSREKKVIASQVKKLREFFNVTTTTL